MNVRQQLAWRTMILLPFAAAAPAWAEEASAPGKMPGWTWPPSIVIPLAVCGALYGLGVARMWRRRKPTGAQLRPALLFALGWLSLLVALDSPLHELGEQLFWVHMTQHEILMLVSAPLLILGRPLVPFLWALPAGWRRPAGALARSRPIAAVWHGLSAPFSAWMIFALALWLWHAPPLFEATLSSDAAHAAQHISFLGASLLFWWALAGQRGGRLGYGGALVYVFTSGVQATALGALLTLAPTVWYAPYAATAPAWGLTGLEDQQIGGLIMWIPAGVELMGIALVLLVQWLRESERRWGQSRTAELLQAGAVAVRPALGAHEVSHES